MIKNLNSSSTYLTINTYAPPNVYGNGNMSGTIRYNTNTQAYEVYDGSNWLMVSQTATVGLSWDADNAIRWAIEKQKEEAELKQRMEQHPGLKDAYEKFQIMDIMTRETDAVK